MNSKTMTAMAAQISALTTTVMSLAQHMGLTPAVADADASVRETPTFSLMAAKPAIHARRIPDEDGDPNQVQVYVTAGAVTNRMTLPREIYIKSKRDSYDHSEREVDNPAHSVVIVDGVKYPQTSNQGRSSKVQISTFGAKGEGQTIVFDRIKGNQWESSVKGRASHSNTPAPALAKQAASKGKGVSLASGKSTGNKSGKVANPFAPKGQTKSPSPTPQADFKSVLAQTVKHVKANAKDDFYNDKVINLHDRDYRVYLRTPEHKAFKEAVKEAAMTLAQGVDKLAEACEK
jgi:hypothetical protein